MARCWVSEASDAALAQGFLRGAGVLVLVGFWLFDFLIVDASIAPAVWFAGVVLFRIELIVLCVLLIGLFRKSAAGCASSSSPFGWLGLFVCVGGLLWASC